MSNVAMPIVLQRRFQLWSYTVSHSVLVLRSNMGPEAPSRIDVMFRSVTTMRIQHRYDGLTIDLMPPGDADAEWNSLGDAANRYVFALKSTTGATGYVVAGSMYLSEDDLGDGEPSTIEHRELSDHVISSGHYR